MGDRVFNSALATRDRYAALLRDVLKALPEETVARWLSELEADLHSNEIDSGDRLESHAMLVGILTVMCDSIEANDGGAA